MWFTNIPSLWLLEGDAGNVKKTELLRGLVRYNFTGHDFHGLALGNDGKIYFSIGDRGMSVRSKEGKLIAYPDEGAVFRSNLDGTELELVHRGLRNPQELVFDEHGNLFTGDNDSDQADQERLVYLVEGGDSGWRTGYQHAPMGRGGPWLREGLWKPNFAGRPAYLPRRCATSRTARRDHLLPGDWPHARVPRSFLHHAFPGSTAQRHPDLHGQAEGRELRVTSQQFIGGVLPTDVTFGPDGVLYLSDWVDGWPKSNKGRIYGITPVNPDPAQAKVSADLPNCWPMGSRRNRPRN